MYDLSADFERTRLAGLFGSGHTAMTSSTIVLGLLNGLIIALLAVGFVLVYKANRFLNLATAQMGAVSALLLAKVVNDWGWDWWLSFIACLALGVGTGLFVERFMVSLVRRRSKSPVRLLILTVGIADVLLALTYIPALTPTSQAPYPQPFTSHLEVGGVVLSGMSILTMIIVPLLFVALTAFFRLSSTGKQIRAAAGNPDAARLCGISVNRVSLITWGIAGGLSALAAVLNGPTTGDFTVEAIGPFLLMFTLGAAACGAFVSIPAAVVGGVGLGLLYQVVAAQTANAGTAELAVFGAILCVILVRGRAIGRAFAVAGAPVPELPRLRIPTVLRASKPIRFAPRVLLGCSLAIAVVFPRLPYFNNSGNQFLLVLVLVYAIMGVSLTILVGWAGQVSLGTFALVGIGAFLTARWAGQAGWSLVDLVPVAGLLGAAAAVAIGLPALRVRGLTLAVATLGLAVVAPDWLLQQSWLGGATPFTTVVNPTTVAPGIGHIDTQLYLYYVVLVVLVLVASAAVALRRSSVGRVIIAVRDNERASSAFGIKPATAKVRVLGLSGFIAGTAGVFWALAWQSLSPVQFPADASIALLALPVIGGIGSVGGVVAASATLYLGTFFIAPHFSSLFGSLGQNAGFLLFVSGIGVVGAMMSYPNGIAGAVQSRWQAYLNRKAAGLTAAPVPADSGPVSTDVDATEDDTALLNAAALSSFRFEDVNHEETVTNGRVNPAPRRPHDLDLAPSPLAVDNVGVRFGGIVALDAVEMEVGPREIVGLIGPNGAGKTSLMNVISGVLRPNRGSVRLFGHEVVGRPPEVRAAYGMARTFQDASLFAGLTVRETVQVAMGARAKASLLSALARTPSIRRAERDSQRRAQEIVESFGLEPWGDALTSELSTGLRRICDLMAQFATAPRVLLLDEPTAGVAQREAEAFGHLVRHIRDELGCSILIIEHDMPLLMGLCDRVYAMEMGRVIAEGTPGEIREDPLVIASYLGTDPATIARSGSRTHVESDVSLVAPSPTQRRNQ